MSQCTILTFPPPPPQLNHANSSVPLLRETDSGARPLTSPSSELTPPGSSVSFLVPSHFHSLPSSHTGLLSAAELLFSPPASRTMNMLLPHSLPSIHSRSSPTSSHGRKLFLWAAMQKLLLCLYCYVYLSVIFPHQIALSVGHVFTDGSLEPTEGSAGGRQVCIK